MIAVELQQLRSELTATELMLNTNLNAHHDVSVNALAPRFASTGKNSPAVNDLVMEKGNSLNQESLVFVDSAVDNIEQLLLELEAAQVVVLGDAQHGIEQISDTLARYAHGALDSVHIISHGDLGSLQLGNAVVNAEGLIEHADALTGWGDAITPQGDILLYGCNVASASEGHSFIQQ